MDAGDVLAIALVVIAYALVSERLAKWSISGPFVFTLVGVVAFGIGGDVLDISFSEGGIELLAEVTLIIILFSDATRIDLGVLRRQALLPSRLLGLGLPLTIGLGAVFAALLFDALSFWEAALLAAILTPTDAALGQAVVSDPRVPIRIRQALNVESGLNDGLMVPIITILVGVVAAELGSAGDQATFVLEQLGFGLLAGLVIGGGGGWLLDHFATRGWVEGALRQIAVVALAIAAFASADVLEGNGFVAAFVAGVVFGAVTGPLCESATDFAEDEGQVLVLLTFLFWGLLIVGPRLDELTWQIAVYAVLSLTVVRMLPVAMSMVGAKLEPPTIGYLGWFGPRGLASILFGLFVVEQLHSEAGETILLVVTWTCLLSVVAHGLTAVPFAGRYAEWFNSMSDDDKSSMPEGEEVDEMRVRAPVM